MSSKAAFILLVLFATAAGAAELEVPSRFPTIQSAIAASANGDVIVVAPGIYREAIDLTGRRVTLRSSGGPAVTILDGSTLPRSIVTATGSRSLASVIEGFTFRNGNGTRTTACGWRNALLGGAVFLINSGLTVTDSVFEDNGDVMNDDFAITAGGAVLACTSDLRVERTRFERNASAHGGAIYFGVPSGTMRLTIRDAAFVENESAFGGAIKSQTISHGSVELERTAFTRNRAAHGAGLFAYLSGSADLIVTDCRFAEHEASFGGGVNITARSSARITITDTDFDGNQATAGGAGAFVHAGEDAVIDWTRCTFRGNRAATGGGIMAYAAGNLPEDPGGRIRIAASRFLDNLAEPVNSKDGGVISQCFRDVPGSGVYYGGGADLRTQTGGSITVLNSVFAGNLGVDGGGGAQAATCEGGTIDFVNTTIVRNQPNALLARLGTTYLVGTTGDGTIRVVNSIVRENPHGGAPIVIQRQDASSSSAVSFSNVEGGMAGIGNIDVPPAFVDAAARDFRLAEGSAGIDAGDNGAIATLVETDLAGGRRFADDPRTGNTGTGSGPIVDMGAFEFIPSGSRRRAARP